MSAGNKRSNLRPRLKSDSAQPVTPVTGKRFNSPDFPRMSPTDRAQLDRIDSTVQAAVVAAMEKERVKIHDDFTRQEKRINDILDEKLATLHDLEVAIDSKLQQMCKVESTVEASATKVTEISDRLDHLEQYSRRNNIRILGVEPKANECTDEVVCDIAKKIGVDITPSDIDRSHRLPNRQQTPKEDDSNKDKKPRHPAIIVKFTSYKPKFKMMKNRRNLKTPEGTPSTVIVEDLTKKNAELLSAAFRKPNVKSSWSTDGRVFALVLKEDGREVKTIVRNKSDLNSL